MDFRQMRWWAKAGWAALAIVAALIVAAGALAVGPTIFQTGRAGVFLPMVTRAGEMNSPSATATAAAAATATATATATPGNATITGLAILGDSTQDEYRTNDQRGGAFAATTLGWVELMVSVRKLNLGPVGTFEEPRRSGYTYNWARSGATTGAMLYWGQHTGAAQQISAGQVSHVLIQIGINDFDQNDLVLNIIHGQISDSDLRTILDTMAQNIEFAIETLRAAGDAKILLATTQDYATLRLSPELVAMNNPAGVQRLIDAFAYLNQRLALVAERQGVAFFDFNAALQAELDARRDERNFLHVGDAAIDLSQRGNDPRFGLLEDTYMHPGTVLSALFTNVYIVKMNQVFGTAILPLSDDEILRAAGIRP